MPSSSTSSTLNHRFHHHRFIVAIHLVGRSDAHALAPNILLERHTDTTVITSTSHHTSYIPSRHRDPNPDLETVIIHTQSTGAISLLLPSRDRYDPLDCSLSLQSLLARLTRSSALSVVRECHLPPQFAITGLHPVTRPSPNEGGRREKRAKAFPSDETTARARTTETIRRQNSHIQFEVAAPISLFPTALPSQPARA
jgi:hypothetical protein